jgi:hypothetical protein
MPEEKFTPNMPMPRSKWMMVTTAAIPRHVPMGIPRAIRRRNTMEIAKISIIR